MATQITPQPPIAGMIEIDGAWFVRRHGLLIQRKLRCIYGHKMQVGGRPFEISIPCESAGEPQNFEIQDHGRCKAQLYIFTTRARMLWAMDVTADESEFIGRENLSVEEIIAHFGVGFPIDMKILRKPAA